MAKGDMPEVNWGMPTTTLKDTYSLDPAWGHDKKFEENNLFGVAGVLGLLTGGLAAGFTLAVFMSNSGGAWDNAKKMIEEGHFDGKGSENHKATIVGDTVGDPFKDTSGPSLNILIKLMSMVSIVMAGLTIIFL